jgi:hypothetical protein
MTGLLSLLPWRWITSALLCLGLFASGYRLGQQGVEQAWDSERLQHQTAALQQSLQVVQVQTRQERINQKIATDHDNKKSILARRPTVLRDGAFSLCVQPNGTFGSTGDMPNIPEPAARAHGAALNAVLDPARVEEPVSCDQLARDAAETTLMVLSFQRWYVEQSKAQALISEPE